MAARASSNKKKSTAKPMFWLSGNSYDRDKAWKKILATVGDAEVVVVDPNFCSAEEMVIEASSREIFSKKPKIVKIKGLPPDYTLLAEALGCVDDNNILVIDGPFGYYDGRGRFISAASSKLYKQIKERGHLADFPTEPRYASDVKKWCQAFVRENQGTIEAAALDTLIEYKGHNLDVLSSELRKLLEYTNGEIDRQHVADYCVCDGTPDPWKYLDALDAGRTDDAIDLLALYLRAAGSLAGHSFYGDIQGLLWALSQHYLFLTIFRDTIGDKPVSGPALESVKKRALSFVRKNSESTSAAFTPQYVGMQLSKQDILDKARFPRSRVYAMNEAVGATNVVCRTRSRDEGFLTLSMNALTLFLCNTIDLRELMRIIGYENSKGELLCHMQLK
jgi:hypothetical protein